MTDNKDRQTELVSGFDTAADDRDAALARLVTQAANRARANKARRAIELYSATMEERDDALTDLLTDLHHYCHIHELDLGSALERAGRHYDAEREGDDS